VTMSTGAVIPLGNIQNEYDYSRSNHTEYVVYDERQICMRYLVQFSEMPNEVKK